jgi:hypothetical protein
MESGKVLLHFVASVEAFYFVTRAHPVECIAANNSSELKGSWVWFLRCGCIRTQYLSQYRSKHRKQPLSSVNWVEINYIVRMTPTSVLNKVSPGICETVSQTVSLCSGAVKSQTCNEEVQYRSVFKQFCQSRTFAYHCERA